MHIFFILTLTLMIAQAAPRLACPAGTQPVVTCTEGEGDRIGALASQFMNGAVICADNNGGLGIFFRMRDRDDLSPVLTVVTQGESYVGKSGDMTFVLAKSNTQGKSNSVFSIETEGHSSSRSLSCR